MHQRFRAFLTIWKLAWLCTAANATPFEDPRWLALLHRFGSDNQVVNGEFFVSGSRGPDSEYNELLSRLRSERGFGWACTFPARYLFIKENDTVPNYPLEKCSDLSSFIRGFQRKRASLVLSSEYLDSPASAFGHVMLVLHDDPVPSLNSDLIHFSAVLENRDPFLDYSLRGLTGGYSGNFVREPFFKRMHENLNVEQRYLFTHLLKVDQPKITFLLYHLFELRKTTFRYYFLNENCAYQLDTLMTILTGNPPPQNIFYTLPIEIVRKHRENFESETQFFPLMSRAKKIIEKMSDSDREEFQDAVSGRVKATEARSNIVKQGLYYYYLYNFRKRRVVPENYREIVGATFGEEEVAKDETVSAFHRPLPRRVGVAYDFLDSGELPVSLNFRPLLINLHEDQFYNTNKFELTALETRLTFRERRFAVDELKFVSVKLCPEYVRFFESLSWSIYSGINRENIDRSVFLENEFGVGQTFSVIRGLTFNYFGNLGIDTDFRLLRPYIAGNANAFMYFATNSRLGLFGKYKLFLNESYWQFRPYVAQRFSQTSLTVALVLDNGTRGTGLLAEVNQYF